VSSGWSLLAWRALPVVLVLTWFLALIGGISAGGLIHVVLLAAVGLFGYQLMSERQD
jgi:hypothetical protein